MYGMSYLKSGQPIQTTGNNLVGLWRPSFVKVKERLFVYGGGGNVTNDLHVLNLYNMRWETIKAVKGVAPCKRYGHTATLWNNYIIVFGGCNEHQEYCNDVHIFDIDKLTWFQPDINGTVPARYLHSASVYDNKLFIYGGFAKNSDCTYVLDELSVLDLKSFTWSQFHGVPPRYNHSATLVGHKMYIYAGKDEHGNTISDLFVVNLNTPPYTPHLVLSGSNNSQMVLLKSQHFCESMCGKLLVFGRYLTQPPSNTTESTYGLWMLDLDSLEWTKQDCNANFEIGGWNYFTILSENINNSNSDNSISSINISSNNTGGGNIGVGSTSSQEQQQQQVVLNNLFFLGNTDPFRPQGYDHFRDTLVINGESLGLYDIPPPLQISCEFSKLLNNPELSDFTIVPANGQELHVHQVILITRWPHFRNIYKSGMLEAQQRRMEIPEPYEVVIAFLKYLYNDKLDDNESVDIICEVLVLANMYLLNRLKKICCERLFRQHLSIDTCGLIFEKAIMAEETGLKLLACDFMFKHLGYILKSNILLQMSPLIRIEFLDAVPEEAVLEVHCHKHNKGHNSYYSSTQLSKTTSINSATSPLLAYNNTTNIYSESTRRNSSSSNSIQYSTRQNTSNNTRFSTGNNNSNSNNSNSNNNTATIIGV